MGLTGLLKDLVLMMGEYVVPLEHSWLPLPSHIYWQRRNELDCLKCGYGLNKKDPFVFASCYCWNAVYQHTCSVHTVRESGCTRWRIHVPRSWEWWAGVIWKTSPNLFQDPDDRFNTHRADSFNKVDGVFDGICIDRSGFISRFQRDNFNQSRLVNSRIPGNVPFPNLGITGVSNTDRYFVELSMTETGITFTSEKGHCVTVPFDARIIQHYDVYQCWPFVQLQRHDHCIEPNIEPYSATIETIE